MISRVSIQSFRGVREGKVEGLAPISILVGPNNAGKSTVLEAIGVVGKAASASEVVDVLLRRGGEPFDAIQHIVAQGAEQATLTAHGVVNELEKTWQATLLTRLVPVGAPFVEPSGTLRGAPAAFFKVTLDLDSRPLASSEVILNEAGQRLVEGDVVNQGFATFLTQLVDMEAIRAGEALEDVYWRIEKAGRIDLLVRVLQRSMPQLTNLVMVESGSKFILHSVVGEQAPVPTYLAGDGFKRFLALAAAALATPEGVVVLDAPESFQHPRYLQELATVLHLAAREGTQIILSTHSLELIDLLLHAPEAEGQSYPTVHRLRLHEGSLRATTLPRENALLARDELLEDLRS